MVETLCQRYNCLPPDIEATDGDYLLRHLTILRLGGHFEDPARRKELSEGDAR